MSPQGHGRYREFGPTRLAIRFGVSVLVLVGIIAFLGFQAYQAIPKEASPEVTIPFISVGTVYPGVAPRDMETLVARVIEEELNNIPQIRELTSTSVEGYASVVAEFEPTIDMEAALQKVREKVDRARPKLPGDAEEPVISEFNLSEIPILQVNVSGEYDLVRLRDVAESLKERLEQIPAVLEVTLSGGLEREVRVDVDLARLKFYGVSYQDVIDAIRGENVTIPGGSIGVGPRDYMVRVAGEFESTAVIEDVVVVIRGGAPIYVRDVATVDFGFKDRDSYARLDGTAVITLGVVKRTGYNLIATADEVKQIIAEAEPTLPPTTVVKITSDNSKYIEAMVASLENNIISGLLLVIAVLLFFLGVRNASLVGLSIPMSMLLSFIVMQALGLSMNMVTLFSLILALGMLVDNAIVVVENIYRFREEGHEPVTAALRGTGEVAMPVVASTVTTLGAFFPLLLWPGIMGEFMKYLPLTLIITLSSSLFVALVIVPVLTVRFMKLDGEPARPLTRAAVWTLAGGAGLFFLAVAAANLLTAVLLALTAAAVFYLHTRLLGRFARWFQAAVIPRVLGLYERQLRWALDRRRAVMAAAVLALPLTFVAFAFLNTGVELFPESVPPGQLFVTVDAPPGTSMDFLNDVTQRLETQLATIAGIDDAESVVSTVGAGGTWYSGNSGDAMLSVSFRDFQDRDHDTFETLGALQREMGAGIAGVDVRIRKEDMGPPTGRPVTVEIAGEDSDRLRALADAAILRIRTSPVFAKLEGLESDMAEGRPELLVEVDRERAALWGLSTAKVGGMVRSAIQGTEAAKFRAGDDEYDIVVRLREGDRSDLDALQNLTILNEEGQQVPLLSVASWQLAEGFGAVRRKDLDRVATVSSDVRAGYNSNAVLAEVQQVLAPFAAGLPPGYTIRYTGQQQEQQEAEGFLSGAFLIALLLIGFVLVTQFNSIVKPVIIMTSVIMSTVGVLLGLMIFRMPFGIIMTGVGVISLAGIVVNNAIVLIDYVDQLRERDGLDRREALVRGGLTRFRPVILTAITTVLGLVPLAIGLNFDFVGLYTRLDPELFWGGEQAAWWGPMAIAVIAGLTFATFLTLVLVPVMYALVDDFVLFFQRHFVAAAAEPALAGVPAGAGAGAGAAGAAPPPAPEGWAPEPEPEREPVDQPAREAVHALRRLREWLAPR
jgi:multidrug efflux pump